MHNYAFLLLLLVFTRNHQSTRASNASDGTNDDFSPSPLPLIPPSHTIQLGKSQMDDNSISTARIKDEDAVLEQRFDRIIAEAATISRSLKYGLERGEEAVSPSLPFLPLVGKLINRDSDGKRSILHFVVEMDGRIVLAEPIVKDISLLSVQELSAIMQYPVISVATTSMQVVEESATWWKIGLIIGGGVLLLFIGWCCLFVYFNTCGRLSWSDRKKEELYEDRAAIEIMEERNGEKSEQAQLDREKKEERRQDEPERQREAVVVVKNVPSKDAEEMQPPARMEMREGEEKQREMEEEQRRDSVESLEISDEAGEELQDDSSPAPVTSSRPRAAGLKRPMRTMDGRVISEPPPSEWTTFTAGDRVNAIFAIRPPSSYEHPTPSPSTFNGVVQYSTSNAAFSNFL